MNQESKKIKPFFISLKEVFEEILNTEIEINEPQKISSDISLDDIGGSIEFKNNKISHKIYYFMDLKFTLSIMKRIIDQSISKRLNLDLTENTIIELNNILRKLAIKNIGLNEELNKTVETKIIKGKGSKISENKITISLIKFNSQKGNFSIGIVNKEIEKIKKEEKPKSKFLVMGQLMEMKHITLTTLNEIKDLKGDSDFLLRKSKAITDLTRLWLEISNQED